MKYINNKNIGLKVVPDDAKNLSRMLEECIRFLKVSMIISN